MELVKTSILKKNTQQVYEDIEQMRHPDGRSLVHLDQLETFQLHLRPDPHIPPAQFRPDPQVAGGYVAHPLTIQAMRKEIFVSGQLLDELSEEVVCEKCQNVLDLQFWLFCPYCESSLRAGNVKR